MMYSVYLVFDEDNPDLEDDAIRKYVNTHKLIPKMHGPAMFDQQKREVMYSIQSITFKQTLLFTIL